MSSSANALLCSRCGEECGNDAIERLLKADPETGYCDVETVCQKCNAEEKGLCQDCLKEQPTHEYRTRGNGRHVCVDCYAAAMEPDDDWGAE